MSVAQQFDIGDAVKINDRTNENHEREGTVTGQRYNFQIQDWTSEVHFGEGRIQEFRNKHLESGDGDFKSQDSVERMAPVDNPKHLSKGS